MNTKVIKSKNESACNSDLKASVGVNSLRKLFEHNFKLSDITKPFKSKSNRCEKRVDNDICVNIASNVDARCRFPKSSKENRCECGLSRAASPAGCYLNCKIENCCCKTFFCRYDETPIFKYRPLPKVPLQEHNGNSRFDRHRPERWSAASCSSYNFGKRQQLCNQLLQRPNDPHPRNHESDPSRNKFYNINYEFYKSKSQEIFDETPVSAVSAKRLERLASKTGQRVNLFEKLKSSENVYEKGDDVDGSCQSHEENGCRAAASFQQMRASVNPTATVFGDGGIANSAKNVGHNGKIEGNRFGERENVENAGLSGWRKEIEEGGGVHGTRLRKVDSDEPCAHNDLEVEARRIAAFGFKCRLPKLKNIGLRENCHPYGVQNSRLTVKSVKNRNMRNVERRRKPSEGSASGRSDTFSGYDNFAYRRSIADPQCKRLEQTDFPVDDSADAEINVAEPSTDGNVINGKSVGAIVPRPASISVINADDGLQFHLDSRMTNYDWPVTSFYIERGKKQSLKAPIRSSSTFHVDAEQSCLEKIVNPVARKTNLKRYRSLGYLEEELFEHNFPKSQRSVENINKASARCEIQKIPEINKIINTRKFQNLDVHEYALFAAVEHGNVEKTKTILESSNVNVNSVNSDGLSPLDIALLSNNKSLVKLLAAHGAQEGRKLYGGELRNHLCNLLYKAESRVQELSGSLRLNPVTGQTVSTTCSSIPSITISDSAENKTYLLWERRAKGLQRMLKGFEKMRPPDPPSVVTVEITSTSSIMVYFAESENENSSITTKFKVQLSHDQDFLCLCGHYEVADSKQLKYHIKNLCKGQSYYVRVASGNIKGYSAYKSSTPPFIVPSSWQDITQKDSRFNGSLRDALDGIFTSVVVNHPYLKNNSEMFGHGVDLFVNQCRKKASFKQLFTISSKFQKTLKRGVYLACLLYHENKVLVTNDDFLPVIEVDENYPRKIHNDFHWFFKVACNWNDLKWVKKDLEKSPNNSAMFRIELLQAAAHMQNLLGLQELGKLYYKMLRDVEGTIVISVINHVHSPKSISVLNLRWLPLSKLSKKASFANSFQSNLSDVLIASIPDQITYHQVSKAEMPRGLYLSYLQMRNSVDSLHVLVPFRTPNMLPHCKIRDNPHVTAEEWEWLVKKEDFRESLASATYQQRFFVEQIVVTAKRLLTLMHVTDEEALNHRLYDAEVIEVNKDISLIMIVPSAEISSSISGRGGRRSHLIPLTVQAFEVIHFETYQPDLISLYSRLSCVVEMDMDLAQYNLRQAFSDLEVTAAKCKLHDLETLQAQLNMAWKNSKWLLDVISFARDRFAVPRVRLYELLSVHPKRALPPIEPNCYLPSPCVKTAKSKDSCADGVIECNVEPSLPIKGGKTVHVPSLKPRVLKIYAAYDTGIDSPIHFEFHVSPRTTARDIVCMFVQQTNMTTKLIGHGRPIFSGEDLSNFNLVATDGLHEFSLQDNLLVEQFEWPWNGARLYVRRKNSLLTTNENESQASYV